MCVELSKLKSPLKYRRALRRHRHVNIAGGVLSAVTAVTGSKVKSPNITAPARKFLLQKMHSHAVTHLQVAMSPLSVY